MSATELEAKRWQAAVDAALGNNDLDVLIGGFRFTDHGDEVEVQPEAEWERLTLAQQDALIAQYERATARDRALAAMLADPLDTLPGERAYDAWKAGRAPLGAA